MLEDYADRLDDEGRRLLTIVHANTQRMSTLIDDILHFSRAGRIAMTRHPIDLRDLTQQVIDELSTLPNARPVRFNVSPLPSIQGDPALLHQVLEKLISNAIKFSAQNPAPVIDISAQLEENETIISVRDNGVGFDMKYSDKLFGVFQRLHGINEFPGTGIGLAIAKHIINRHGGRIWAEAQQGKGATCYFTIPLKESTHE